MSEAFKSIIGQTIDGRYEILELIGQGGMGSVYKARHTYMDKIIALKIIRTELRENETFLKRFLREVQNASKIRHPNAIEIYDSGEVGNGLLYMAMEFIEGKNLKEAIARHPKGVSVGATVYITRQICNALEAIHSKGIIHRDLKPDNILVSLLPNKNIRVKVLDFGISKIPDEADITRTGIVVGTPAFMSPEQGMGKPIDNRSDIYSLGVIMYAMLTGQPPFKSDTPLGYVSQHNFEPPPSPREFREDIPDALVSIILKCLEKKPEDRFQNATTLLKELNEGLQGKSETAEVREVTAAIESSPEIVLPRRPTRISEEILKKESQAISEEKIFDEQAPPPETRQTGSASKSLETPGQLPFRETFNRYRLYFVLLGGLVFFLIMTSLIRNIGDGASATPAAELSRQNSNSAAHPTVALDRLVSSYLAFHESGQTAELLSLYGSRVLYFDRGLVDKTAIFNDKDAYFRRWPNINYRLLGNINIAEGIDDQSYKLTFFIHYTVRNNVRGDYRSGKAQNNLGVRKIDGQYKIVEESQQVIHDN